MSLILSRKNVCVLGLLSVLLLLVILLPGTAAGQATGTLEGTVENQADEGIDNANITADGTVIASTSSDGSFRSDSVLVGIKEISVEHPNYDDQEPVSVTVETNDTARLDFTLDRTTTTVSGTVLDGVRVRPQPLPETPIKISAPQTNQTQNQTQRLIESGNIQETTTTNEQGAFEIDVPVNATINFDPVRNTDDDDDRTIHIPDEDDIEDEDAIGENKLNPIRIEVEKGYVKGTVTSAGEEIIGATVSVDINPENWPTIEPEEITDEVDSNGYNVTAPEGPRSLVVEAETFQSDQEKVRFVPNTVKDGPDFELTHYRLTVDDVTPQTAQSGETVTVEYTYSGTAYDTLNFTLDNQEQTFTQKEIAVTESEEDELTFEIPERDTIADGTYTITLATPRRTATETIRVSNPVDPEAVGTGELDEESYRAPAGGFVEITTGGEYMLIGGDTDSSGDITQYLDVIYVEEGSSIINTRLIGTNVTSERAYGDGLKSYAHSIGADSQPSGDFADVSFQGASTLAEFRQTVGIGSRSTPLQTGRYRLLAGENGRITIDSGTPRFRKPVGRSNLVLTQPQLEAVNTYVLPPESANAEDVAGPSDDATESNTIAAGERLLIEIQATGMYGAAIDDPTVESIPPRAIADLLSKPEGVDMDLSTWYYDGSDNTEADVDFADKSSSDVYIIPDDTTDQWDDETVIGEDTAISGLYIVVDTRGEAFSAPAYGDVMQFTTAYESPDGERYLYPNTDFGTQPSPFNPATAVDNGVEQFPYYGASDTTVSVNSTIEYMEPSIQYGRTTFDGDLVVPAEDDGQVLGSSTLAPGTEATIQFIDQSRPDPELVTIEEVTIEEDRTFTASADFSELSSGDQVTAEFYTAGRLPNNRVVDRRSARVVENISNIANYQITNFSTPIEVQQRASLSAVEATINNTGELTGQQVVRFSIDGEPIRNESLRLSGGGNATLGLADRFVTLPVGTYEYTIQTDNDEQTGELQVTEPDSGTTITSEDTNTTATSSPLDENEVPDENDRNTDPSSIFGLIGVSSRDVALGAALTGAAHVLGYWT